MIACISPRCPECSISLSVCEPFVGGVWQRVRCPGCTVQLQVRRMAEHGNDAWLVRTDAESARMRLAPLPAVAPPKLRHRFFDACRTVARMLQPCEGVEPGMSSLEVGRHE